MEQCALPCHVEQLLSLRVGQKVMFWGKETEIISYVPTTGKYVLAGIGNPVFATELTITE